MTRTPIHPGEILGDELEEIGMSARKLADLIQVPPNRLYQILAGKRNVTAATRMPPIWRPIYATSSATSTAVPRQ